ncbi:MAG: flagellar protein FlaJ [Candidatus Aramenus sulfurataquae]|jgi:flagellar protein FlaJ
MKSYLEREIDMNLTEYYATMNRKIESMANFISAYYTLSSALIFSVATLTLLSILFNIGTVVLRLMALAMIAIIGMLTIIVYVSYKPETYIIYKKQEKYLALIAIQSSLILIILTRNYLTVVVSGILMLGIGMYFRTKETKLNTLEKHYVSFVTYFSRTYSVVNNLRDSLISVLRGDVGAMRPLVTLAINRLEYGVRKSLIFELMGEESGSMLISMLNRIISAAIEFGGDVRYMGEIVAKIGTSLLNLRARREQNGRAFEALVYALQATSAAIGGALLSLLETFENIFAFNAVNEIFTFGYVNIAEISMILLLIFVALSFANGISIAIAYGKTFFSGLYFIGILLIITALAFHFTYVATEGLFKGIFQEIPPVLSTQI